ncbi:MAG: hypothetical protein J6A01_09830, partial [Proteobacteria bacterium]|nr:hypothetical protein [Pseudomonadota bacterium]
KLKVSVDGEIRYLYYAEMPDRCYIRGWSFYEISESNYDNNKREPYIRYIGSISGENDVRADYAVYRALKDGLYIKSKWNYGYGDIYLVKELETYKPLVKFETINGDYFEVRLANDSTHYLYREMVFIHLTPEKFVYSTRYYEITAETFHACCDKTNKSQTGIPPYIRYLGAVPSQSGYSSDREDKEKAALYKALTGNQSIYSYICDNDIVVRNGSCALHEPFEIPASVCDHDSNEKYHYAIWKALLDGKDVVWLLLIQPKEGDKTVKIYEIGEGQLQNAYKSYYRLSGSDIERVVEIDDSPDRRYNIFKEPLVYYYRISNTPEYGGIPLNDALDAPAKYIRLVCTLPETPDVFSEDFCKSMYDFIRCNKNGY